MGPVSWEDSGQGETGLFPLGWETLVDELAEGLGAGGAALVAQSVMTGLSVPRPVSSLAVEVSAAGASETGS